MFKRVFGVFRVGLAALFLVAATSAFAQSTTNTAVSNESAPSNAASGTTGLGGGTTNASSMYVPGTANVTPTGAFTYSVPIVVPPGTASMVPSLSLNYSSQSGDGFEGLGWSVGGLSAITRCPRTLAQDGIHGGVNYDAGSGSDKTNDRFCLDGQRLILVSGHYGAEGSVYHTEIESFTEVIARCDVQGACTTTNGPDWFEVHLKSGRVLQFGNTTASANNSRILISNPPPGSLPIVRQWLENNCADTSNNYFTVTYDVGQYGYPTEIDYTGNSNSPAVPTYNSVQFKYKTRNNIYKVYQAGSSTEINRILTNIETFNGASLVSNYVLDYNYAAIGSAQFNEMKSISRCSNTGGTVCLASTTFGWQGSRDTISVQTGVPVSIAQGGTLAPGDWNGDGLTDVIVDAAQDTPCNIYFGQQSNSFVASSMTANYQKWTSGTGTWVTGAPACFDTFATFTTPPVTDFSGDGFTDLVITQVHDDGIYFQTLKNSQSETLVQPLTGASFSMGANSSIVAVADFDGDGLSDIAAPTSGFGGLIYTSQGDGTFKASSRSFSTVFPDFVVGDFDGDGCSDFAQGYLLVSYSCQPAVSTSMTSGMTGTILAGDFNGDGKDDIIDVTTAGTAVLYFSTGTGFTSGITLPGSWDNDAIYQGDFNGDGKLDVALIAPSGSCSTIWLGTGSGFVQANDTNGHPVCITSPGNSVNGAVIADWNNDGAADLWIQANADATGVGDEEFLISYVPELMTSVSNGLCASACATTSVQYDRLNHGTIYTKETGPGYPTQDVINASYVVSKIFSSNGIGGSNSVSYAYAGGETDLKGRGFLGFTTVKATDGRTHTVTTTTFSTQFPLTGTPLEQVVNFGSTVLSDTLFTFTPTTLSGPSYLVELTEKKQIHHTDLDGISEMPVYDTTYTYDTYANPHVVTTNTYANEIDETHNVISSDVVRTSTWTNNTSAWVLGQPLEQDTESDVIGVTDCSTPSNCTRHLSFVTDHTTGLVKSTTIEPGSATLSLETDYTYDVFGNVHTIEKQGPGITTRVTTLNFDSNGEFLTSLNYPKPSSNVAQNVVLSFDARFGGVTTNEDVNSQTTTWIYDAFGRLGTQINSDKTGIQISYTYCLGVNGGTATCATNGAFYSNSLPVLCSNPSCSTSSTIGPYTKITSDLLLRPVLRESQGFGGTPTSQSTIYDGHLHVHETSRPIFTGGTYAYTERYYDDLDRETEIDTPYTSGAKTITTYGYAGLLTTIAVDTAGKDQITTSKLNPQGLVDTVAGAMSDQTTYVYDGFGNATNITTNGHAIVNQYDIRGRKQSFVDSDMGSSTYPWTYQYDALSELTEQIDADGNQTNVYYDVLGRPTSRTEVNYTSTWNWDTASNGIGKLAEACNASSCASATYSYTPSYDTLGRVTSGALLINGTIYTYGLVYNANQRLGSVTYPSGFQADYNYTLGYLSSIVADGSGTAIWTANEADAELHLTQSTAGNGIITSNAFDPDTGNQTNVGVGVATMPYSIGFLSYQWDRIGNLTSRTDHIGTNKTESFCYDDLNRLTSYGLTTSNACPVTVSGADSVEYGPQGNMTSKSDVGTYTYGGGSAGSHALTSIAGSVEGVVNPNFFYDQNGNMLCMTTASSCMGSAARSMTWKSFNMLASLTDNITGNSLAFMYDTNHARIRQCSPDCASATTETDYVDDPVTGTREEVVTSGSSVTWNDYVQAAGQIVAMRTKASGNFSWLYFTGDHLGSISIITDSTGSLISGGRQAYDSWGLRRNTNWTPAAACNSISSATTRAYTQQEETDAGCLLNLNGRMYDPIIGRFLSADPIVPNPLNTQSYNRYSYVNNHPLTLVDPTGYDDSDQKVPNEDPNFCSNNNTCPDEDSSGGSGGSTGGSTPTNLNPSSGNAGDSNAPQNNVTTVVVTAAVNSIEPVDVTPEVTDTDIETIVVTASRIVGGTSVVSSAVESLGGSFYVGRNVKNFFHSGIWQGWRSGNGSVKILGSLGEGAKALSDILLPVGVSLDIAQGLNGQISYAHMGANLAADAAGTLGEPGAYLAGTYYWFESGAADAYGQLQLDNMAIDPNYNPSTGGKISFHSESKPGALPKRDNVKRGREVIDPFAGSVWQDRL